MTKRKEQRRELLKEDELHSSMEKAARYMQQNPVTVLVALVGLLAVVFGGSVVQSSNRAKANEQAGSLYVAEKILQTNLKDETEEPKYASEKEKYEAALAELDKTLPNLKGTAKHQALVTKAGVLTSLGKTEGLAEIYADLADNSKGALKLIGLMGQADLNYAEGRYDEAISGYDRIENDRVNGADYEDLVIYKKALCQKAKGDVTTARQELTAMVDRYEGDDETQVEPPIMTKVRELLKELDTDGDTGSES